jgi:outer membrane autotransporter protein
MQELFGKSNETGYCLFAVLKDLRPTRTVWYWESKKTKPRINLPRVLNRNVFLILFILLSAVLILPVYSIPINTPFLLVDIDGDSGDTAAGWSVCTLTDAVTTDVPEIQTIGSVTVTMTPIGYDGGGGNDYMLIATKGTFGTAGVGRNNIALLNAIQSDMGSASGDYINVINALSGRGVASLNTAAEQLSPLPHASLGTFNATLLRDMGADMSGYLLTRRNNTQRNIQFATLQNSDLLLADASENPDTLSFVISETERRRQMQEVTDQQTNSFFRPFGVFFDIGSTDKFTGFQAEAVGAQFGADKVFGTNWIVGLSGAYSHSRLNFDESLGDADIDSFRVGPYATYYLDKFYVDSSVSFGYHLNKTRREITTGINRTAEGHYNAYDLAAYVGGGYEFNVRQWIFSPTISAQYICYRNESFRESGAGAAGLNVDAQTQESLLTRFGIRLYTMAIVETMKLAPEFFVGYAHEFMDEEDLQVRFQGGVTKFSADIDSNRDDSVYYGAGLSGLINDNISAFVRYEGEYYGGNRSSAIKLGLALRF